MSLHHSVRSNDPTISLDALDHVYLGLDDNIEYDPLSSIGPDVLDTFLDQSLLVYSDDIALFNDLALYLGPDDELIDCDEDLACADIDSNSLATQEGSLSAHVTSPRHHSASPELTNEELYSMVQEFWPLGSYDHTGLQSIKDQLAHNQEHHGNLPDPSIQQLLKTD
ncbi:hypothetical protein BD769DRAFT_1666254 [Suillus cothurnatus]|nr:hypothetical protein BD769DRAFT_1666254 [Suillus cothurnatus]